jgi:4-methyl-5(b-hydroxyethyl)-thiazole monophosphate biosynthesis
MEEKMVYVHLADGFEEVEALTVVDVLRRAQVPTQTVSIMEELTVTGSHEIKVIADVLFDKADYVNCDMAVLPGGGAGAQKLLEHEGLRKILLDFARADKWIAAICAAPMILARNGLLKGRNAVIYDGMEDELTAGGAVYKKQAVVADGKIITSRSAGTAMSFALELAGALSGRKTEEKVCAALSIL